MTILSRTLGKATVATLAAGAMALASTTPAMARDREHHDGIGAGGVIAGALVLGGIAAVLASKHKSTDYRYTDYPAHDPRYRGQVYGGEYNRGHTYRGGYRNSRYAVRQCVRAAKLTAQRRTGGQAQVYRVSDINRHRRGLEVRGTIAVRHNRFRGRDRYYGRHYRNSGWDRGSFSCAVRHGRVVGVSIRGIRGMR